MGVNGKERFALALLLAAPSNLSRAWTRGNAAAVQAELAKLPFSAEMRAQTEAFLTDNNQDVLPLFDEVATLFSDLYVGTEPHPNDADAIALVTAMRQLDGEQV